MAFQLSSIIKIGSYSFPGGVNELTIKKNVHIIVDTAVLKIPGLGRITKIQSVVNAALNLIGLGATTVTPNMPVTSVQTALLFNEGDAVSIDLGYNGQMQNEFRGFVRRVNLTTPITIEMEGYAWQLRNQNLLQSWQACTVLQILQFIIQGTNIVLAANIPVINLTSFHIKNQSGLKVLEYLKTKMLLTVYFADNVLYVGIEEGAVTAGPQGTVTLSGIAPVTYNIGYNCPFNQPDLKKRLGADNLVRVRLKTGGKNGNHVLYEAGDLGGAVTDKHIAYITDPVALQRIANAFLQTMKYDGYEGKITGFLQPFCLPGWKAIMLDKTYNNARAGAYFVPGIEVEYGAKGAKRIVEITYNLTPPTVTT